MWRNRFRNDIILAYIKTKVKVMAKQDLVNERVNTAQQELAKRAQRLDRLVASRRGKMNAVGFDRGVELVREMIENQSKLYDVVVFDMPKTALEQHRNLMLATGTMNQSVQEGIKTATDAIDAMLHTLEQMSR